MIRLVLKPGREQSVLRRHPWLFSGAVVSREGDGSDGLAEVVDGGGLALAHGAYSERSQILARLWSFDGRIPGPELFEERFERAKRLREETLPPGTTGLRMINSEGDLCPGVVVDLYGGVSVIDLLTEGTVKWEREISAAIRQVFAPSRLVVRRSGADRDRGERFVPSSPEDQTIARVPFSENGLSFFADLSRGQKTGFFLDQRENRQAAAVYAATLVGRDAAPEALDAFCYTGGFSVHLARAGCRVNGIDISETAVAAAAEHARLNGVEDRCAFEAGNAFDLLRAMAKEPARFDLVVLDPPAFARSRSTVPAAAAGYKEINLRAMKLLRPGGILVSCSCSAHVSEELLIALVAEAAHDARRTARLLEARTQARDHPIHPGMPETRYLKCLILEVT